MKKNVWKPYIISILIAEAVGLLSGLLAGNIGTSYRSLVQPPLSPPGWLFPVVWVILYALMGIAAAMIWRSPATQDRRQALYLYAAQLFVNFWWSILFFRFELFWFSAVWIILLDLLVIATILQFYKINQTAAWLLVPYLIWILFATYLNIGVAVLN